MLDSDGERTLSALRASSTPDIEAVHARAMLRARLFDGPPPRIGRYDVVEKLGVGGMGVVYRCHDPMLRRDVAVKLLLPGVAVDPRRIRREAQALAQLNHPNVVDVYEVGETDEHVFVAMALVEGPSLAEWLAERRPLAEILAILIAAGRGLAAAHDAGIVHRDFKPANVLVGSDGRPRIVDFGLARAGEEDASSLPPTRPVPVLDRSVTATGALVGTPLYVAPELWRGRPADARSDQWSYCVALWEACYGQRPFSGTNPMQLARAVLRGAITPPPPSIRLPGWLRSVLRRGLSREPAARFRDMQELVATLERGSRNRSRWKYAAAGLLAVGAAAGLAWPSVPRRCADPDVALAQTWNDARRDEVRNAMAQTSTAQAERMVVALDGWAAAWRATHRETCETGIAQGDLPDADLDARMRCLQREQREVAATIALLAEADDAIVRRTALLVDGLPRAGECLVATSEGVDVRPAAAEQVASLEDRLAEARAHFDAGRYGDARDRLDPIVDEVRAVDHPPLLADVLALQGRVVQELGDLAAAETVLNEAFTVAIAAEYDAIAFKAARDLAFLTGHLLHRYDEAAHWGRTARASLERLGNDEVREAQLLHVLAEVDWARGGLDEAASQFERALEIRQRLLGEEHTHTRWTSSGLAAVYRDQGRLAESRALLEEVLRQGEAALGPDHLGVAETLNTLSATYFNLREYDAARDALVRALSICEGNPDAMPRTVANMLSNLGLMETRLGNTDAAEPHFERALAILEEIDAPIESRADLLSKLADLRSKQSRPAEALVLLERARALDETGAHADHPDAARRLANIGLVQLELGAPDKALDPFERALAIFEKHLPARHPFLGKINRNLGQTHALLGEHERAIERFERSLEILAHVEGAAEEIASTQEALADVRRRASATP